MSMDDLERALEIVAARSDADFEGPKSEHLITEAERALGLRFPPTYRTFLARLGCGNIGGLEVFGLLHSDFEHSGIPDAVWVTCRRRVDAGLPQELILVEDVGDGSYCAIDTMQLNERGEAPVIVWMPGADNDRFRQVSDPDFGAFLYRELTELD